MDLTLIKATDKVTSETLHDRGVANEAQGEPVPRIRSLAHHEGPDAGVWECSPGTWRRAVVSAEFCHIVSGRGRFYADGGESLELEAGDAVVFPPNTNGTWEILTTLRKTYVLLPGGENA